ncbi:hypothetical protein ACA910_019362 [Epithemia clementina (nom. ined.)]
MPVFPPGIEPYTIRPPLTTGDKGDVSDSILHDARRVLDFMEDERHLTAQTLLHSVQERIHAWDEAHPSPSSTHHHQPPLQSTTTTTKTTANNNNHNHDENQNVNASAAATAATKLSPSLNKASRRRSSVKKEGQTRRKSAQQQKEHDEKEKLEMQEAKSLLEANQVRLDKLENRCRLFRKAQKNLQEESEWILASTLFGIETYYRREPDESLSLKLQGEVTDIPLFEQVCVLREVDLHYKWAPFCSSSFTIADLDKLDTVGWFLIGLSGFGLARDGCFRAIGCDNIQEDGSILLAGQGIQDLPDNAQPSPDTDTYLSNDPIISELPIPPKPTRRGADRMTIRTFDAIIHVTSPTSATTKIVANIDPNIRFLPQSLLEFIMKQVAGVLLAKLQSAAKKVVKHPVTNEHARKMRHESNFYQLWLMAKFQAICEARGWDMPPVNAFSLSEEDLAKEGKNSAVLAQQLDQQRRKFHTRSFPVTRSSSFAGPATGTAPLTATTARPLRLGDHNDSTSHEYRGFHHNNTDHGSSSNGNDMMVHVGDDEASDVRSDCVSELTNTSGRSWYNKPVRSFLAKREQKRMSRKEAEIRAVRHMAAQRIQPKPLSPSQLGRLEQLRGARAQRLGEGATSPPSSTASLAEAMPNVLTRTNSHVSSMAVESGGAGRGASVSHHNTTGGEGSTDGVSTSSGTGLYTTGDGSTGTGGTRRRISFSERITDRLQAHGKTRRFWVMSFVLTLFFLLLNPELCEMMLVPNSEGSILPWSSRTRIWTEQTIDSGGSMITDAISNIMSLELSDVSHALELNDVLPETSEEAEPGAEAEHDVWKALMTNARALALEAMNTSLRWIQMVAIHGGGLLFYLCLCTILHFFVCDIALVYAFNALDLGAKTGRQVKKFYSDKVRLVVAAVSASILFLSLTKALARIALSAAVWVFYNPQLLLDLWNEWVVAAVWRPVAQLQLPFGNETTLEYAILGDTNVSEWMLSAMTNVTNAIDAVVDGSLSKMTKVSGAHGGERISWSMAVLGRIFQPIRNVWSDWVKYLAALAGNYVILDLDRALDTWQSNAFETARVFFSYSAVPLLIFLVLFNCSARWALRPEGGSKKTPSSSPSSPRRNKKVKESNDEALVEGTEQIATTPSQPARNNNTSKGVAMSPQRRRSENGRDQPHNTSSSPSSSLDGSPQRRSFRKSISEPDPHQQEQQQRRRMRFLRWTPQSDLGVVHEAAESGELD